MPVRRGSWPPLLLLATAFLLLFYGQRSRSSFLQIDRERPTAQLLADQVDLDVGTMLALRDMIGLAVPVEQWTSKALELQRSIEAAQLAGELDPVVSGVRLIAPTPLAARRFALLRERFAARR